MNLIIENKLINPGVINLTQFSSGTDTLIFELENTIYENLDFKDDEYVAYAIAVLPTGKMMDKIELEKNIIDKKLTLTWKVTNYTTKVNGTLTYQIVFENTNKEVVWYSNNALMFVNSSINADDFLTSHFPTLLQQWMLKMEQLKILIQECTGVPVEGLQGQYLRKKTDEDFDCEWADVIDDSKNSDNQTFSSKKINNLLANKAGTGIVSALKNGLMSKEDKAKLDGIESEAQKNVITGIKGDKEEEYRVGNVNITPANIGASPTGHTHDYLPTAGGALEGGIETRHIFPAENNAYDLGSAGALWKRGFLSELLSTNFHLYNSESAAVMAVGEHLTIRSMFDINTYKPITASAFTQASSRRYKKNIREMTEDEANKIDELEAKIFDYKKESNGVNQTGLIAEDVYKIFPNVVTLAEVNGKMVPDSIDYSKLVTPLLKKVQMLEKRVTELESK